ncbi:MAG: hypothetical protein OXH29_00500 [bacterium]|nr:hypothetical protein [bacterium]
MTVPTVPVPIPILRLAAKHRQPKGSTVEVATDRFPDLVGMRFYGGNGVYVTCEDDTG